MTDASPWDTLLKLIVLEDLAEEQRERERSRLRRIALRDDAIRVLSAAAAAPGTDPGTRRRLELQLERERIWRAELAGETP